MVSTFCPALYQNQVIRSRHRALGDGMNGRSVGVMAMQWLSFLLQCLQFQSRVSQLTFWKYLFLDVYLRVQNLYTALKIACAFRHRTLSRSSYWDCNLSNAYIDLEHYLTKGISHLQALPNHHHTRKYSTGLTPMSQVRKSWSQTYVHQSMQDV